MECGRSSGVEHNLAKVGVGRSNRLARSSFETHEDAGRRAGVFVFAQALNLDFSAGRQDGVRPWGQLVAGRLYARFGCSREGRASRSESALVQHHQVPLPGRPRRRLAGSPAAGGRAPTTVHRPHPGALCNSCSQGRSSGLPSSSFAPSRTVGCSGLLRSRQAYSSGGCAGMPACARSPASRFTLACITSAGTRKM